MRKAGLGLIAALAICMVAGAEQGRKHDGYKIGDTGPGGGIVFYVEGNSGMEVSHILGNHTWSEAIRIAKEYEGGGFNDWHLPSSGELNLIYQNLQKSGVMNLGAQWYWSSSENNTNLACAQRFSDGTQLVDYYKYGTYCVRAVRAFSISS